MYNKTIEQKGLNLEKVPKDHVLFWYHCECGGKARLKVNRNDEEIVLEGTCPICKNNFRVEINNFDLSNIYKSISFEAVSRELIVPDVLGTDVYIEGLGGSLSFRQISNTIAEKLKFNRPLVVRWKSHDKYISVILHKEIFEFVQRHPISSVRSELRNIAVNRHQLYKKITELDMQQSTLKNELKKFKPQSNEFSALLEQLKGVSMKKKKLNAEIAKFTLILSSIHRFSKAYNMIPSIVDEFLSVGFDNVLEQWLSDLKENDFNIEHILQLPLKKIEGIYYKEVRAFVTDVVENYHPGGDESGFNTL